VAPSPIKKICLGFFSHFFISRFAECRALGKEGFAECPINGSRQRMLCRSDFCETALPRAALDKGFAENLRGFAESLGHSAKQPAPVVMYSQKQVLQ
jgi:hypothetical protein